MGKREVKVKWIMNREQLAAYLEEVVAGLREGTICVQKDSEKLLLHPSDAVKVKIEAVEKKDKYQFEMELEWVQAPEAAEGEAAEVAEEGVEPRAEEASDGSDDQGDNSYKKLKKQMKKSFKEIKAAMDASEMPPIELVETFFADCQKMTNYPGKGDEFYAQFTAQVYDVLGAAQSGDLESFASGITALDEMKNECHTKFKG